jgi:geranylgeranyl transferase type-2 subunit alpha
VRTEESRRKELQQIAAYRELEELVNTKIVERQYTIEVLGLITKLLQQNPEYYTIWNHRRRVLRGLLDAWAGEEDPTESLEQLGEHLISGDLQLTFTLLRKFPKCYWIWNHRNWILQTAEALLEPGAAGKLWSGELNLVSKMLQADSRNFHAWGYRRFVVDQLDRLCSAGFMIEDGIKSPKALAESEFEYTTKMINSNLSNFSAWHYRSRLIPRLLNLRAADNAARRKLLDDELALICTAINTDPFDQSIWYYHQYLMSTLSLGCPQQSQISRDLTNNDRQKYFAHEMNYIQEILEDETECKWIYEGLLRLAASYLEVDGGTKAFTTLDMRSWLGHLKRLDPLRHGRWEDLGRTLGI